MAAKEKYESVFVGISVENDKVSVDCSVERGELKGYNYIVELQIPLKETNTITPIFKLPAL
jgi:hypothetical protein